MLKQLLLSIVLVCALCAIAYSQVDIYDEPIYLSSDPKLDTKPLKPGVFNKRKAHFGLGLGFGESLHSATNTEVAPFIIPKFSFDLPIEHSALIFYGKIGYTYFNKVEYNNYGGAGNYESYQVKMTTLLFGIKGYIGNKVHLGGCIGPHFTSFTHSSNLDLKPYATPYTQNDQIVGVTTAIDLGYLLPIGNKGHGLDLEINYTSFHYPYGSIYVDQSINLNTIQFCTSYIF